jgi:hypothetical protein
VSGKVYSHTSGKNRRGEDKMESKSASDFSRDRHRSMLTVLGFRFNSLFQGIGTFAGVILINLLI